jgi:LCP family protein required for cell wall assembly
MKKKTVTFTLVCILVVGIVVGGVYLYNLTSQPLGRPLTLVQPASGPSVSQGTAPSVASVSSSDTASPMVCGQRGTLTILTIGSDAEDLRGLPGSDLTRLVRVDFSNRKISTFALPRDLWVDVSQLGFQDPLITETTLGKTYFEGHQRSAQVDEPGKMTDGAQVSAQMIIDNFGVTSDHYLVIDLDQLPALVEAIGGLPIDIPEQTTDRWIGTVIETGSQTLSGAQLRSYARAIPDSDFARIQRSNLIIQALRQKLLDPSVWVKLPSLYDLFAEKMIVTDLSYQQIFSLFCLVREVPTNEIVMQKVEPAWTAPGPSGSLLWDKGKVISALKQLNLLP